MRRSAIAPAIQARMLFYPALAKKVGEQVWRMLAGENAEGVYIVFFILSAIPEGDQEDRTGVFDVQIQVDVFGSNMNEVDSVLELVEECLWSAAGTYEGIVVGTAEESDVRDNAPDIKSEYVSGSLIARMFVCDADRMD